MCVCVGGVCGGEGVWVGVCGWVGVRTFKIQKTAISIIAQQDATQSSLFIILQVRSTCLLSVLLHLAFHRIILSTNKCEILFKCTCWLIIKVIHSTCFGCQPHPSSGVHKTVTAASGTGHIFCTVISLQRGEA